MPNNLPPHIVMFARAMRSREIARFLRGKDNPEAQRSAQIIEGSAKRKLQQAEVLLAEDRRARRDVSTSLSHVERMLVRAEYCRLMAEWLNGVPQVSVQRQKSISRLTAVPGFLKDEARRIESGKIRLGRDGTRGSA